MVRSLLRIFFINSETLFPSDITYKRRVFLIMNGLRALVKGFGSKIEFQSALVRTEIGNHWIVLAFLRNRLFCNNIDAKGSFVGNMIIWKNISSIIYMIKGHKWLYFTLIRKSLLLK